MYQVLYRKWRPKRFSDVIGQPQATVTLANEIISGKISHAYLFTGTRGTGKTTCARILAKALCCEHPINGDPCNECDNCLSIDSGSLMDVVEIDAASNRSIEDIKNLKEKSTFLPTKAKYRIYIIDEVHMLSADAFNALLKLIEEPPEHLIFIFATTEIHKVLPTIRSRCQNFNFRRIDSEDIAKRLEYVTNCENREITHDAALMIARISDGAMRDSLSLLDRCLVYDGIVTEDIVSKAAGIMGRDRLFELSDGIINSDIVKILRELDELHRESCDSERICSELIEHFRNFMLVLSLKNPAEAVICTPDDMQKYKLQASKLSTADVLRIIDVLMSTLEKLKYSKTGRAGLETAMVRLCIPETETGQDALLARIAKLERKFSDIENGGLVIQSQAVSDFQKPTQKENTVATIKQENIPDNDGSIQTQPPFDELPKIDDEPMDVPPFGNAPDIDAKPVKTQKPTDNDRDIPAKEWNKFIEYAKQECPSLCSSIDKSTAKIVGQSIRIKLAESRIVKLIGSKTYTDSISEAYEVFSGKKYTIKFE